jgi:hypothetical protein
MIVDLLDMLVYIQGPTVTEGCKNLDVSENHEASLLRHNWKFILHWSKELHAQSCSTCVCVVTQVELDRPVCTSQVVILRRALVLTSRLPPGRNGTLDVRDLSYKVHGAAEGSGRLRASAEATRGIPHGDGEGFKITPR